MKKAFWVLTAMVFGFTGVAYASPATGTQILVVPKGTVACISKKLHQRYFSFVEQGAQEFADNLVERADCYIKGADEKAVKLAEVGDVSQVLLESGHRVWLKTASLQQGAASKTADKQE